MSNEISNRVRRFLALLLGLAALAAADAPAAALTPNGPHPDLPPQREILLNGLRIATVQKPGDRVAVVCVVRAGAMFDPADRSGLANVVAGLLSRGAGSYTGDRIRGELEDAGATLNVRTDWDATWLEGEAPAAGLATLLDVMSLMVTTPRLAPEDIEAVKKIAIDHVAAELRDPNAAADRAFAKALYGRHTYGRAIWGDAAAIASITPGDVRVFYDRYYAANAAVVGVVGPVPGDAVVELARARFGRWGKKKIVPATFLPPTPPAETRVVVVDRPGAPDAIVRAGFWTDGRSAAGAGLVKAVAARLGADLAARLGGPGAAASFELRTLQSPFVVAYEVPVARLGDSIRTVSDALAAVRDGGALGPRPPGQSADSTLLADARRLAAADYFGAQKLVPDPGDAPVDDARVQQAARTALRSPALTFVVVGDAKQVAAVLKDTYKIEVAPST